MRDKDSENWLKLAKKMYLKSTFPNLCLFVLNFLKI